MPKWQKNNSDKLCLHFVGIGGIGMSALAEWALRCGYRVSGSDIAANFNTQALQDAGAIIFFKHDKDNAVNADIIVYSTAVPPDNPELLYGIRNNICLLERHKLLGIIFNSYDKNIAVTGSHGKTTCTAMTAQLLLGASLSTLCFLGGNAPVLSGRNFAYGDGICLAEACEYKKNFLSLKPSVAVILNIESDHTDYFKSSSQLLDAFKEFTGNIVCGGTLVICGDDINCKKLLEENNYFKHYDIEVVTYGLHKDNVCRAENLRSSKGKYSFDLIYSGQTYPIKLSVPGKHNVLNAMAAFVAANYAGAKVVTKSFTDFLGVCRRFEYRGMYQNADIISDYAHHPREIAATLKSARQIYKDKKIAVVFQPHTYSRTRALIDEFSVCFNNADYVLLLPVYSARENYDELGSSTELIKYLQKKHPNSRFVEDFPQCVQYLDGINAGAILVMGAGDVASLCEYLLGVSLPNKIM